MRNGQVLEFDRSHLIGYATFWRLVQSAIWPNGIEEQLRRELVKDLDEIWDATAMAQIPAVIFGERLPKHRVQVWYEAFSLGVVAEESADSDALSTQLFRESCRLLGRSYRGPLADCYIGNSSDSGTTIDNDLTKVDSSSDASGPIIPTANRPELQESPNTDT